jgi:hypothetical protein
VSEIVIASLQSALKRYGAQNYLLRVVYSSPLEGSEFDASIHRFIDEADERWGAAENWLKLA